MILWMLFLQLKQNNICFRRDSFWHFELSVSILKTSKVSWFEAASGWNQTWGLDFATSQMCWICQNWKTVATFDKLSRNRRQNLAHLILAVIDTICDQQFHAECYPTVINSLKLFYAKKFILRNWLETIRKYNESPSVSFSVTSWKWNKRTPSTLFCNLIKNLYEVGNSILCMVIALAANLICHLFSYKSVVIIYIFYVYTLQLCNSVTGWNDNISNGSNTTWIVQIGSNLYLLLAIHSI